MTDSRRVLLQLLRTSLHPSPSCVAPQAPVNWQELMQLSFEQGVGAVVFDVATSWSDHGAPMPRPVLMQWAGQTAKVEQVYRQHVSVLQRLARFYAAHGARMVVLKGYGCSLNYPHPERRPAGDIDIYLPQHHAPADDWVEQEWGIAVRRSYHKHSTFSIDGTTIESHAKWVDDASHKSNARMERLLEALMRRYESRPCPIEAAYLPPATCDALFLLRHAGEHFAASEIRLRHVADIGTFFDRHHGEIDWPIVQKALRETQMHDFFCALATLCIDELGFSATIFGPTYEPRRVTAEQILLDIFACRAPLPMSTDGITSLWAKMAYGIGKTARWYRHRWKYRLVYGEGAAASFWWLARNRIKSSFLRQP